jgi:hypothetical protein
MAKSKKRRTKGSPSNQGQRATPGTQDQEEEPRKFEWIPPWGWILIFVVPLVLSEFMFYRVGRWPSMILFPVAWIGLWVTLMQRSGWPILKKRRKE